MELAYETVDDLTLAATGGKRQLARFVSELEIGRLGPAVEYLFSRRSISPLLPSLNTCRASPELRAIQSVGSSLRGYSNYRYSLQARVPAEFAWPPIAKSGLSSPDWTAFCKRLEDGARRSGFSREEAAGIVAAFREMVSNLLEHSERPGSGLVGYRTTSDRFEYVVADLGIGVLGSLRKSPEFLDIADAGEALTVMLQDGVSCKGTNTGRGMGFRQVFLSLADLFGTIRFRSGDHALSLDGRSPGPAIAQVLQRPKLQGFTVSVECSKG